MATYNAGGVGELARAGCRASARPPGRDPRSPRHRRSPLSKAARASACGRNRGLDIGVFDACFCQRLHQKVGGRWSPGWSATVLPLRSATVLNGARPAEPGRFALRRRRLDADINQRRTSRLGEDRRRLAGGAEVDGADIQRFQELVAPPEIRSIARTIRAASVSPPPRGPSSSRARGGAVFLKADADGPVPGMADGAEARGQAAGDDERREALQERFHAVRPFVAQRKRRDGRNADAAASSADHGNSTELRSGRRVALQDWQQPGVADCCQAGASWQVTSDAILESGCSPRRKRTPRNNGNGFAFSGQ